MPDPNPPPPPPLEAKEKYICFREKGVIYQIDVQNGFILNIFYQMIQFMFITCRVVVTSGIELNS